MTAPAPDRPAVLVAGFPDGTAEALARHLRGARIESAATAGEAAHALRRGGWRALLAHARLAPPDGAEVLRALAGGGERMPVFLCVPADVAPSLTQERLGEMGVGRVFLHPLDHEEAARELWALLGAPAAALPQAKVATAVKELWNRFRDGVLARVSTLEEAAAALAEGRLAPEARRDAEREAHKLAGSVGTFGFARGSALARQVEALLRADRPLDGADATRLAELAAALRADLERPAPYAPATPKPAPAPDAPGAKQPLLLVVDDDGALAERLAQEAAGRGMRAVAAASVAEARAAVDREAPDAALVGLSFAAEGADAERLALVSELAVRTPPIPVVVLSARAAFGDRVEVARHGGVGFLPKPVTPTAALDAVQRVARRGPETRAAALTVDDDPQVLAAVKEWLEGSGVVVHTLDDPLRFWDALEAATPDVLLLDVDMPHLNGIELCRVVRNDPRWSSLPVVFLTSRNDADTVQRIFAAGADDYVAKPFVGPELVTRVANRLERVQLHRILADTDPLTGIANRRRSEEAIGQFVRLAQRQGQAFSLAAIDIDHFKAVNDRHGHGTGDEVLRRVARLLLNVFRAEDVVARWGGEEFAVGLYGLEKAEAVRRLEDTLDRLRLESFRSDDGVPFTVTFSAGVAQFPGDGGDVAALHRTADAALYQAKETGRNRVLAAGWRPEDPRPVESVDVLVVDDDPAVAAVLLDALAAHGYRARAVADGDEAATLLLGERPALRARLVLLDADLPGRDGYEVLRALGAGRVLERTRVIVVSAHAGEADVLRALEAGAWDHVAKPFSVPVLLQRVRRAVRG